MKRILLLAAACVAVAVAQSAKPFLGRWDLNVTPATGKPYPQWMELTEKDGKIEGRVQPRGGGWVTIKGAQFAPDGKLIVNVSLATARGPAVNWELASTGADALTGIEKRGDKDGPTLAAVRAPKLDRPMPKAWEKPVALFNGKDLTGWEPFGNNVANNKWVARDGELVNDNPMVDGHRGPGGANIKTTAKFQDFKLHIEVNCPEGGNSGIYLRGRYEIQVGTEGGKLPDHEMGAVYSHYPPPPNDLNLGKWSSFDITFVGRRVTVVRDGKMYHDNVEIPGPTGGALDSNEAEPGPFFLQGDHYGVIRYRNITVSVPKK